MHKSHMHIHMHRIHSAVAARCCCSVPASSWNLTYSAPLVHPSGHRRFQVLAFNGSGEGPLTDIVAYKTPGSQLQRTVGPRTSTMSRTTSSEGVIAGGQPLAQSHCYLSRVSLERP